MHALVLAAMELAAPPYRSGAKRAIVRRISVDPRDALPLRISSHSNRSVRRGGSSAVLCVRDNETESDVIMAGAPSPGRIYRYLQRH